MRTRAAHIEPGCPYCEADHNPDIECRYQPESVRFQLQEAPAKPEVHTIRNPEGRIIAVRTTR